jgi:ankyrin repeat protein
LMLAAADGYAEAVKALIELKANVNVRNAEAKSALELAKQGGHDDVVALLKAAGATEAKASVKKP